MTSLVNRIAQEIRKIDGTNQLHEIDLAWELCLTSTIDNTSITFADLMQFMLFFNSGKHMGASELAQSIVDQFRLEKDS